MNISPDTINTQTDNLIAEFQQHYRDVCDATGDLVDKRLAFEGWAIQKLASIQLMIAEIEGTGAEKFASGYLKANDLVAWQ